MELNGKYIYLLYKINCFFLTTPTNMNRITSKYRIIVLLYRILEIASGGQGCHLLTQ